MDSTGKTSWKPESHRHGAETAIRTVVYVVGGMLALTLLGYIVLALLYAVASQS